MPIFQTILLQLRLPQIIFPDSVYSGVVTAVMQHALSLPPPHPVELFSAAIRCYSIIGSW